MAAPGFRFPAGYEGSGSLSGFPFLMQSHLETFASSRRDASAVCIVERASLAFSRRFPRGTSARIYVHTRAFRAHCAAMHLYELLRRKHIRQRIEESWELGLRESFSEIPAYIYVTAHSEVAARVSLRAPPWINSRSQNARLLRIEPSEMIKRERRGSREIRLRSS